MHAINLGRKLGDGSEEFGRQMKIVSASVNQAQQTVLSVARPLLAIENQLVTFEQGEETPGLPPGTTFITAGVEQNAKQNNNEESKFFEKPEPSIPRPVTLK